MSVVYCNKSRRQFLVGAGKTALLLPILPSLLPREAFAQATATPKRMMLFWFDHNNLTNIWPDPSVATTAVGSNGAREILLRNMASATAVSPVFSHQRWENLRQNDQLTILRGFDTAVAYGPGHGNFTLAAAEDRNSEGGHPTIDTFVEASSSVYPSSTPSSVRRVVRIQPGNPSIFYNRVGSQLQALPGYHNNISEFYNQVFSALSTGTPNPAPTSNQLKTNILNRAHAAFTSFRNNRRISSDDRARLDQHMGYLSDLQRSFEATVPQFSCTRPTAPNNIDYNSLACNEMYLRLLAVAFKCGLTKFGVFCFDAHDPQWIPNLGVQNFHDAIHGGQGNNNQLIAFRNWWQFNATQIATHFLEPMSEMEGDTGRTYLSNMITGMICAGGMHGLGGDGGHSGLDSQQILIGNMGGALRSGRYVALPRPGSGYHTLLPYNTFLITLLQLMGVPSSEYSRYATGGQGVGHYGGFSGNHPLRSRFYQPVTEVLAG